MGSDAGGGGGRGVLAMSRWPCGSVAPFCCGGLAKLDVVLEVVVEAAL